MMRQRGISRILLPFLLGFRYGTFAGAGYDSHDLEFTKALEVEDLDARHLVALRLYAESEGYQFQATKASSLSDITDREASGASTTLRRSQSGNAFQKLAESREKMFKREVARPYWTVDTFGLTEYLWSEHRFLRRIMGVVAALIVPIIPHSVILRRQRPKRIHSFRWYCERRGARGRSLVRSY